MTKFRYQNEKLHCEDVSAESIAQRFGTPTYVYSRTAIAGIQALSPA